MIETHPFGFFVPKNAQYLLLGSFTTKEANFDPTYDWFYGTKRNYFWPILRAVYGLPLATKKEKQDLFTHLRMALGDIIYQCERIKDSNLDVNLVNVIYNLDAVAETLSKNKIKKIFFSSRFVEGKFRRFFRSIINHHPDTELITLPSPSPRYAALTPAQKLQIYKSLLPKLP
ncbi:MAG: hypothetical protein UY21_C0003G0014 [Microgenomates group bacterium GW2011_GWA1_48_10]|nr:MAG: hypothetical protein UY21_C0003G0014 [Microgenomates group bacterium GW2011_GWA1_48_10]